MFDYLTFRIMNRILSTFVLLLFLSTATIAQSSASVNNYSEDLTTLNSDNWSFYIDEENKVYYIDFESISVNLSTIVLKNENGEVLLKDDVLDLPVNTIYELDFSPYGMGNYEVELRSFTGIVRKKVSIK